jgi:integrase
MPDAWRLLGNELDRYAESMLNRGLSEKTVKDVVWALRDMYGALEKGKLGINRKTIGQSHIDHLQEVRYKDLEQSYVAHNLSLLRQHLKWAGNRQIDKIRWPVRGYGRPNADWLEDHEAMILKQESRGIERMIVHCELDLAMRRIEVLRLKTESFRSGRANSIVVHGKGRHGGKWRTIPWAKNTPGELEAYLRIRDEMIAKAQAKNPTVEIPKELLIYERNGRLFAYKKSALENFLDDLSVRTGIEFSNHTLRRTCGRMMWRAKVPPETIAQIFGHSDTKTTMLYLGIDQQDMAYAMDLLARYQEAVKCPEKGILEDSQQESGPCGISFQTPGLSAISKN